MGWQVLAWAGQLEVIKWILDMRKELGVELPSKSSRCLCRKTLNEGKVVPGLRACRIA